MFRRTTLISLTALLCGLGSSAAQADMTCTKAPDCASLGYTQTEAECASKPSIKCPFDTSKYYCKKTPVVEGCTVGSYLYADKTCSSNYQSSRTLVGVVFDPVKKLAVMTPFLSGELAVRVDVNMPTCSLADAMNNCRTDGKVNTRAILGTSQGGMGLRESIIFGIVKYDTDVVIADRDYGDDLSSQLWYGKNHWYSPSLLELDTIYKNLEVINNSWNKVGTSYAISQYAYYASSTYNEYDKIFTYDFSSGRVVVKDIAGSGISTKGLAVINYGDPSPVLNCTEKGTVDLGITVSNAPFGYDSAGCIAAKCPADKSISTSIEDYQRKISLECSYAGYCLGEVKNGLQYYSCCKTGGASCLRY